MSTLKKIVQTMLDWSNTNPLLGTKGFGEYFKVDTTTNEYTIFWITPTQSTIKNGSEIYTFDIMFGDLLDTEESNLLDVWNDTDLLCRDFVATFQTDNGDIYNYDFDIRMVESNVQISPFKNLFDSNMAGQFMKVDFIVPKSLDYCKNPTH